MTVRERFEEFDQEIQAYHFLPKADLGLLVKYYFPIKLKELKDFVLNVTKEFPDLHNQFRSMTDIFIDDSLKAIQKMVCIFPDDVKYNDTMRNEEVEFIKKGLKEFISVSIYKLRNFPQENILSKEVD